MSEVTGTRAVHLWGGKWQRIGAVYFYAFHTWLDKFPDEFVASYASVFLSEYVETIWRSSAARAEAKGKL